RSTRLTAGCQLSSCVGDAGGRPTANAGSAADLELHLLGPLELIVGGEAVALGRARPRALLAVLGLELGRLVSVDRLVDSLWPGRALEDFAYEPFAQTAIARLEEERRSALEDRIEADLALGLHAQLVGELQELAAREPLRERIWAQLMLALYRSGRQADALAA